MTESDEGEGEQRVVFKTANIPFTCPKNLMSCVVTIAIWTLLFMKYLEYQSAFLKLSLGETSRVYALHFVIIYSLYRLFPSEFMPP